ncbi:MAG: hypothetical protein AB7S39_16095 [Gemmatimonadales bacterium]
MSRSCRYLSSALAAAGLACSSGGPGPSGPGADLRVSNVPGLAPYHQGFFSISGPNVSVQEQLVAGQLPFGWIYNAQHDVRGGDVLTVSVRPAGAAATTFACTVASRGVLLGYLDIAIGQDPDTGDPGAGFCRCGFREFAGTEDPNRCQP